MKRKTYKRLVKNVFIVGLVLSWLLTGWPGFSYLGFDPEVKEVQGITCGFGTEIGTTGVCRGFLTTAGSNQTWTTPSDWNNNNNTIECIGGGGSGGAAARDTSNVATGGGGGAYSLISNFNIANPGTTQITYRIGSGGTSVSSSGTAISGNTGGDTWFNSSTLPASGSTNEFCSAKGGVGGNAGAATQNGGVGGIGNDGHGQTRRDGGAGGTASHSSVATGGGGAAGNSSTGGSGVNSSTTNSATTGGQANGSGASGGSGGTTGSSGSDGSEYSSEGSGGGGGGGRNSTNSTVTGGSGGKRGGGGGAGVNARTQGSFNAESGVGYDGVIVVTYTPAEPAFTQNDFEWFVDEATVTLTDPWPSGSLDLAENEVFTQLPATKRPLVSGDRLRIQMNVTVSDVDLSSGNQAFQLEYVAAEDCTTATGWATIGAQGSGTIWRFFDNTSLTDGVTQVNQISTSTTGAEGRYLESNSASWTNPNAVNTSQNTEWDFAVENNGAAENTTYCFRMTKYGGTALDTYNSDSYPKLTTAPGTSSLMRHGNFYQNETERGFFWSD